MQQNLSHRVGIGITTTNTAPGMAGVEFVINHEQDLRKAMDALSRLTEPPSFEEIYEEVRRTVGYDESEMQSVVETLRDQYRLLHEREIQLRSEMNHPIDWMQEMLPLLMVSGMMGDPEMGVMSMLMTMLRQPALERAKQDRYWRAITDVLGEKNKVIAAIRSWEVADAQQRQHFASQARMLTGRISTDRLKRVQMLLKQYQDRLRLDLQSESDATRRLSRTRGEYYRVYDQLLRTLERYHNIESRAQIYQSFTGLLEELARESGINNPPHRTLMGVLQTPSLRATQAMLAIANAAQRLELNNVLYHSAQLGLVNRHLAIERAGRLLQDARAGRLSNLTPGALLTIASAIDFYKAQARTYPELNEEFVRAYGPDWEQELDRIYGQIAVQVVQAANANQQGQMTAQQLNQLAQAVRTDPTLFQQYLAQIANVQRVGDIPIDRGALRYFPVAVSPPGHINTYNFSAFVTQLVDDAMRSASWHMSVRPPLPSGEPMLPDTGTDLSALGSGLGVEPTAGSESEDPLRAVAPSAGARGMSGSIATIDLEQVLYQQATSTNILNLHALTNAYVGNQQIVARNGTPESNRALQTIQSRHLVYLEQPNGRRAVVPLIGVSAPTNGTDPQQVRRFNGLQAHGFLRDANNRVRIAATVPVPIVKVGDQSYDLTQSLRALLNEPNISFDVDITLVNDDPVMVVSALYPFTQNGRRAGYRVPVLMMSPAAFGQMMSARIGNWQQVPRARNEQPIPLSQVNWGGVVTATFSTDNASSLWSNFLRSLREASEEKDANKRAAKIRALWQRTRQELNGVFQQYLNGGDFFRSVRWIPIPSE